MITAKMDISDECFPLNPTKGMVFDLITSDVCSSFSSVLLRSLQ